MRPAYDDGFCRMFTGDASEVLSRLPEKSVHTCVTSPPYFGLRSYLPAGHPDKAREGGTQETPEAYVEWLVGVMRGVWRVLRDDGTLWLNLGDSYANTGNENPNKTRRKVGDSGDGIADGHAVRFTPQPKKRTPLGLKSKDLIGMPWRVAFALQADGWILRSEITWVKPAPMPESVRDRPTSATEKVFLFAKSPRYFYDQEAVREPHTEPNGSGGWQSYQRKGINFDHLYKRNKAAKERNDHTSLDNFERTKYSGRNMRNYWLINPRPFPGSHYATFPPELPMKAIKAGTSERGVCSVCGAPWRRVVERSPMEINRSDWGEHAGNRTASSGTMTKPPESHTIGWEPTCEHLPASYKGSSFSRGKTGSRDGGDRTQQGGRYEKVFKGWEGSCDHEGDIVPATVLDPFSGSGTTGLVARKLGRRCVLIDLDERNVRLLEERMGFQGVLL